jgi:hypothetical protein
MNILQIWTISLSFLSSKTKIPGVNLWLINKNVSRVVSEERIKIFVRIFLLVSCGLSPIYRIFRKH